MPETASADMVGPYTLPPLPYDYAALEPIVDEATMRLHHDAHHKAYVDALNKALEQHPEWLGKSIKDLMRQLEQVPDDIRQTVRNNGGGHLNHSFFWQALTPPGSSGQPSAPCSTSSTAISARWTPSRPASRTRASSSSDRAGSSSPWTRRPTTG